MPSLSSPPSSPLMAQSPPRARSPIRAIPLSLPAVANLIVKLRRSSNRAKAAKDFPVECTSGAAPQTHAVLTGEGVTSARKVPMQEQRRFLCRDGVDVKKLLRAVRASLLEEAQMMGATVLVDEQ